MKEKMEKIVGSLDERILGEHGFDKRLFDRLLDSERELGLLDAGRPFCPFMRPHFLSRSQYNEIAKAAEIVTGAFDNLTVAALENREILDLLDLSEKEERMARLEPRYKKLCVSSRLDAFLHGDDFAFLEYNAESPAGIGDQMQLEKVLEQVLPVKDFLALNKHWRCQPHRRLLEALISAYRETGGKKARPGIAIVDWRGVSTETEFHVLKDYFESEGFPVIIADPDEFEYDGKTLRAGDFVTDIFYKRVIIHEFLEKFDETHPLARAYADGNVCMANSFRVKVAHKKAGFAVLSDERYAGLFTPEQLAVIRRHVPWTRRVKDSKTTYKNQNVDLLEFLRREREKFLLKPNDDYGGKGITLGWETSQENWEIALNDALQKSFVVQERVAVGKILFPMFSETVEMQNLLIDFNPFLFFGEVEGGLVRLSGSSIVNVSAGGGQTALIVLEDF